MTNMQFYIAIGVPSILIILSWMQQDKRLSRLESTIDMIAGRVNNIDSHLLQFYSITGELKGRVDEMAKK